MTVEQKKIDNPATPASSRLWCMFALIVAITFLWFMPDLKNGLLEWDDTVYITYNEHIRSLTIETVRWALVEFYTNYWAPLTWLSYAFDYAFWGLNPVGYHLTNNIIHALNAGLFFLLALRTLTVSSCGADMKTDRPDKTDLYTALLAALIFSIHPLRVESVAWAAERKDVLSLFFGIGAVLAYIRYLRAKQANVATPVSSLAFVKSPYFWISLVLYGCSLLSKSTLVTLPFVLLVIDWFPLRRLRTHAVSNLLIEKLPYLVCAFLATAYTVTAHKQYGSIMPLSDSDVLSRILLALKAIMSYLCFTLWPRDISPFYVHPGNITQIDVEYILAVIFFVAVSFICVWKVKKYPIFMSGWLTYLFTLLPVIGFVKGGNEGIAARYSYAASMPVSLLVAIAVATFLAKQSGPRRTSIIIVVILAVLAMGAVTIKHQSFWHDDVTLWTRVIDLQPHATGRAYYQRANAYVRTKEFQKALPDVNEALAIAKRKQVKHLYPIYGTRAEILKNIGDKNGALEDYSNAIESAIAVRSPRLPQYYIARGALHQEMGDQDLADEDFRQAGVRP